jgi:hypothetical protein
MVSPLAPSIWLAEHPEFWLQLRAIELRNFRSLPRDFSPLQPHRLAR